MSVPDRAEFHFRSIWVSDIHLGTRGCQAEALLDFLRHTESDTLYLVGDIIDMWRLKRVWFWDQAHNDVVQKVLRKARKGTRVVFITGNHDEKLRDFTKLRFGRVSIQDEAIHTTADGRRLLVVHGDQHDAVVLYAKWLAKLGDHTYQVLLAMNRWLAVVRRRLGFSYWSLSSFLKRQTKKAVQYINDFEGLVAAEARRRGLDGVVCGHIHHAAMHMIDGVLYCNDGDWVESCTALVEHADGRLEILDWMALRGLRRGEAGAMQPAAATASQAA